MRVDSPSGIVSVAGLRKPEKGLKRILLNYPIVTDTVAGLRKPEKGLKHVPESEVLELARSQDSENPRRD